MKQSKDTLDGAVNVSPQLIETYIEEMVDQLLDLAKTHDLDKMSAVLELTSLLISGER